VRLAALFSGGKDSTFAIQVMEMQGHEVPYLVSIVPSDRHSWVFHTPNLHLVPTLAQTMGKELISEVSDGSEEGDLEALRRSLTRIEVDGVITGALASDYQWDRINGVCNDLRIPVYSPLWRKDQRMLMKDMVASGLRAIMVVISAEGLKSDWLGRRIDTGSLGELDHLARRYGFNVSGEGGEFETLVIDSPLFDHTLSIKESEIELTRDGGRLTVGKIDLERKG
jgi:ABC transporter with metal-binding/Fe-S-binding domain ATP-binding protein